MPLLDFCLAKSESYRQLSLERLSFYSRLHFQDCLGFRILSSCGHRSCSYYAQSALIEADDMFDVNATGLMNDYENVSHFPQKTSFPRFLNNTGHISKTRTSLETRLNLKYPTHVTREFGKMTISEIQTRITNTAVHNLSSRVLSETERALLGMGLNCIPTPRSVSEVVIRDSFAKFARSMRIKWFFKDSTTILPKLYVPNSSWDVPLEKRNYKLDAYVEECRIKLEKDLLYYNVHSSVRNNFSKKLQIAATLLAKDKSIVIKPADKNLGVCIMDTIWYRNACLSHLHNSSTYMIVTSVPMKRLVADLIKYATKISRLEKDKKLFTYITTTKQPTKKDDLNRDDKCRICRFYILPKLHKTPIGSRPICSQVGWITETISVYLDIALRPILLSYPAHLLDSNSLVKHYASVVIPPNALLLSYDVENMYPSIDIEDGLRLLRTAIFRYYYPENGQKASLLIDLLEWVLRNTYMEFDGVIYRQIQGTAMGSPVAVTYACIYMFELTGPVFASYANDILSHHRYIDDGCVVWVGDQLRVAPFIFQLNILHPSINITYTISPKEVVMLDVKLFKGPRFNSNGILDTCVFQKELNRYQYLPWISFHPRHVKLSFIRSELRRYMIRECSKEGWLKLAHLLYYRLRARGYPRTFLVKAYTGVTFAQRSLLLLNIGLDKPIRNIPPFIILPYDTYTSAIDWKDVLELTSNMDAPLREVFTRRPFAAFKNGPSLRSTLVRSRYP